MNLKIFKFVFLHFVIWVLAIHFIAYMGLSVFPSYDFYQKQYFPPTSEINYWERWGNWDGGAFRHIAEEGYTSVYTVFFPGYPLLIKLIMLLNGGSLFSALFVSYASALAALFFLYKLVLLDFDEKRAKLAVYALLAFPASFYLITIYSDGLALALGLAAFYCIRTNKWILASLLSGFSVITRLVSFGVYAGLLTDYLLKKDYKIYFKALLISSIGRLFSLFSIIYLLLQSVIYFSIFSDQTIIPGIIVTLLPIILIILLLLFLALLFVNRKQLFNGISFHKIMSWQFLVLFLSVLPFIGYLYYQQVTFGSFLTFLTHEETIWGRHLRMPWDAPLYAISVITTNFFRIGELPAHMHMRFIVLTLNIICLVYSYFKLRFSYTIYFFIGILIPLLSGSLGDFMRFSLTNFPLFMVIALIKNEYLLKAYYLFSVMLLGMFVILFINGYFFI